MCLIIAIFSLVFAINFLMHGNILLASISAGVGLFFAALMIRNIRKRIQEKKEKQ
ncbi:MAG: hypothetical protein ACXWB0_07660 [Sulfuricurvum sp.]